MKTCMKHSAIYLIALVLCLASMMTAQAEGTADDAAVVFCEIPPTDIYNIVSLTVMDNTIYHLMINGDIYAWKPEQTQYSLYAHVPVRPWFNVEIPLSRQSESIRIELMESVSQLIPSEYGLYGFNDISGMIGFIDSTGWHVNDVRMDTSALMRTDFNTGYPQGLRNAYVENGMLYAFYDIYLYHDAQPQTKLLVFDLFSGVCSATDLPDVISFCRYAPGKILCLQDNGTETPVLAVYDTASQQMSGIDLDAPVSIPRQTFTQSFYLHRKIDGLAYDARRDIIYLQTPKHLWRSIAGTPFEPVTARGADVFAHIMLMEPEYLNGPDEAWVLSSGGYVSRQGFPCYVKP